MEFRPGSRVDWGEKNKELVDWLCARVAMCMPARVRAPVMCVIDRVLPAAWSGHTDSAGCLRLAGRPRTGGCVVYSLLIKIRTETQ